MVPWPPLLLLLARATPLPTAHNAFWGSVLSRARFEQSAALDAFCGEAFDEARFVDRTRLSGGVVLAVDAATDAQTRRPVARGRIRGPGAAAVPAGQRAREVKCHADPAAAG